MWRILSTVNSQAKTERRPTFLKDFPNNRAENNSFQGLSFQVSGLSFSHSDFSVFLYTHRVRKFIYQHVVLHLLVLSLRCDIEYCRLETATGSQSRTEQRHSDKLSCYCGKCTASWGERVTAQTTFQIWFERELVRLPGGSSVILSFLRNLCQSFHTSGGIKLRPIPSKSFPICHSSAGLPFDAA